MKLSEILKLLEENRAVILVETVNIYVNEAAPKEEQPQTPTPPTDATSAAFFAEGKHKRNGKSE